MCMFKGPGFACAGNGCTGPTDSLIASNLDAIEARENVRKLSPGDASPQLVEAISVVETHFRGVASFTERHDALTRYVVEPLCDTWGPVHPKRALERLEALRARLSSVP